MRPTRARFTARAGGWAFVVPVVVFGTWRLAQLVCTLLFDDGSAGDAAFRWDAQAYRRIFESGYHVGSGERPTITAFFPGVAWATQAVDVVSPSHRFAELLTVNVIALLAFVAVFGATRAWRDDRVATRAVVLLALFPSTLFLSAFYSEGLFIALGAGAFWADRRGRFWIAVLCTAGAAATRPVGLAVAGALIVGHLVRDRGVRWPTVAYAVAGLFGIGAVMVQLHAQMGDALAFIDAQKYWNRELDFPWRSIREGVGALRAGDPRPVKVLDLVAVGLVVGCVVYAIRRRRVWPVEAWLLPMVVVGLPLCGPYLSSMNRFVLSAWPTFAIGGEVLGRGPRLARWAWYGASAIMAVIYARYWAHGDFVA